MLVPISGGAETYSGTSRNSSEAINWDQYLRWQGDQEFSERIARDRANNFVGPTQGTTPPTPSGGIPGGGLPTGGGNVGTSATGTAATGTSTAAIPATPTGIGAMAPIGGATATGASPSFWGSAGSWLGDNWQNLANAGLSYFGDRSSANNNNAFMAWLMDPQRIAQAGQQLNPGAAYAMGQPGYMEAMGNIGQNPGYIDPALMNQPYTQIERGGDYNMERARGMMGRQDPGGYSGLGQAYASSNLADRTNQRAQVAQQYALDYENRRRADLQFLNQLMTQGQQTAAGLAGGQASTYQQPPSWMSYAGNYGSTYGATG